MNLQSEDKDKKNGITALILMCIVIVFLFLISWFFIDYFIESKEDRGTFGDKFGSINALFSGLAFAGLIYTIILQRKDLEMQREELELTRKEMKEQTAEFEKQNQTSRLQQFETTFFNMLELQQSIVNGLYIDYQKKDPEIDGNSLLRIKKTDHSVSGRDVFRFCYDEESFTWRFANGDCTKYRGGLRTVLENFGLYGYNHSFIVVRFDHYFRHFYRIIKFVDNIDWMSPSSKYEYISILRATLSPYEIIWLYYNGLSFYGEKLKTYIEKYSLLNNIRLNYLTITNENKEYLKSKGIFESDFENKGLRYNDFLFYLSEENCSGKYTIRAFGGSEEWHQQVYDEQRRFNELLS